MSQFFNTFIDNLQAAGDRVLELPLFMLLAGMGVAGLGLGWLIARFAKKKGYAMPRRVPLLVMGALGVVAAVLLVDRKIARLEDAITEMRTRTASDIAAALTNAPTPATRRRSLLFDLDNARRTLTNKLGAVTVQPVVCDEATDFVRVSVKSPLAQAFLAVVDLTNPKLEMKFNINLEKKTLTSSFARDNDCSVSINGEAGESTGANSGLGKFRGYMVSLGKVLLREDPKYPRPFLTFDQQNRASFIPLALTNRTLAPTCYGAIWGRTDLLVNGAPQSSNFVNRAPRTAMGINKDGTRLYLLVVDGRQEGYSMGMTLPAVGQCLQAFGAYNAMACDEGGSSCMFIKRLGGIVDSPSDNNGRERPTYSHFGIRLREDK